MIVGAWFHPSGIKRIEDSGFIDAVKVGIKAARTYHYEHSEKIANILADLNMSLYAGIDINPEKLLKNWRSEVRQDQILKTLSLNAPLVAICLGNELREYTEGELPNWKFSGRLAFALSNLVIEVKNLVREHGFDVPITYAMEGFGLGADGKLQEWVIPIVEAVDLYSVNCYPMEAKDWFTLDAFKHNKEFLTNDKEANLRLVKFEYMLRSLLNELEKYDKYLVLSEFGIHAGVDYKVMDERESKKTTGVIEILDGRKILPIQDANNFMKTYILLANMISRVNRDYSGRIRGVFIYEWRDNPFHKKIKTENSPIHACFGLCYVDGRPKFDISKVISVLEAV